MMNFPANPVLNQQHSAGVKSWKWNGVAWDLTSISEAQVKRAEDAAALAVEAVGYTGINYDKRSEVTTPNVVYRAEALPGSSETAPVWRICRINIVYGNPTLVTKTYPDGNKSYNRQWSARSTYNYSN